MTDMTKKTWQQQVLKAVGEQILSNDKLRETVTREVIRAVGRGAGGAAPSTQSTAPTDKATQAGRGDVVSQVREIWEHPTVQGAVKGGLSTATQQARQWQGTVSGRLQQRADERLAVQLAKRQQKGQDIPAEAAQQLEQRQREREEQQMMAQLRQGLLTSAADPYQRQVLQRVFESTPWLGGTREPLRYTQLLSELGGAQAQTQMALHQALWALAEQKVVAVLPHGEIQLLPEETPAGV